MASPFSFNSLTPTYGPLTGGGLKSAPVARPSGRSWMDPTRMDERLLRLQERAARSGGGGGGRSSGAVTQGQPSPLPVGAQSTVGTKTITILPPTATSEYDASAARRYGQGRLEAMGASFEPKIGVYDTRTGLSQTLDPAMAMKQGLLGSAQRALLAGLASGQTFSRSNPFV